MVEKRHTRDAWRAPAVAVLVRRIGEKSPLSRGSRKMSRFHSISYRLNAFHGFSFYVAQLAIQYPQPSKQRLNGAMEL
jgi:hypothetical protein